MTRFFYIYFFRFSVLLSSSGQTASCACEIADKTVCCIYPCNCFLQDTNIFTHMCYDILVSVYPYYLSLSLSLSLSLFPNLTLHLPTHPLTHTLFLSSLFFPESLSPPTTHPHSLSYSLPPSPPPPPDASACYVSIFFFVDCGTDCRDSHLQTVHSNR